MKKYLTSLFIGLSIGLFLEASNAEGKLKVFIFAGQSNMVGSDSNVKAIDDFPPYVG